jgi:hypothetical protein
MKENNPFALGQNGNYALANRAGDPSSRQKLLHFAEEVGVSLQQMQGSAFNLFDTVTVADSANPQTLEFFRNTTNKQKQFSNFQKDLKVGEGLVIEYVQLSLLTLTGSDLTAPTTRVTAVDPVGQTPASVPFVNAVFRLTSANGVRIKDYVLTELEPWNNPSNCGIALTNLADGQTLNRLGANFIFLPATPIVLPNNELHGTIEVGPLNGLPANSAVKLTLGRRGSIYSANTPL